MDDEFEFEGEFASVTTDSFNPETREFETEIFVPYLALKLSNHVDSEKITSLVYLEAIPVYRYKKIIMKEIGKTDGVPYYEVIRIRNQHTYASNPESVKWTELCLKKRHVMENS